MAEGVTGRPVRRGSGLGLLAVVVGMLRIEPVGYPLSRFKVVEDGGERLFTAWHDDILAVRPLHNLVTFRVQSVRSFRAMHPHCPLVIRAAAKTVYSTFYSACDEWRAGMAHSGSCTHAFCFLCHNATTTSVCQDPRGKLLLRLSSGLVMQYAGGAWTAHAEA